MVEGVVVIGGGGGVVAVVAVVVIHVIPGTKYLVLFFVDVLPVRRFDQFFLVFHFAPHPGS